MNKETEQPISPAAFWAMFALIASYRQKLPVTEVMVFANKTAYYICPRCHKTLEREFMSYCDRCGQFLCWRAYKKAAIISPEVSENL